MAIDFNSVKKSYGRCVLTHDAKMRFFRHFYDTFLNSHPAINRLFANTDFDKQISILKNAISMTIMYAEKQDDLAKDVLTKVRKSHARDRYNVKPAYYTYWLNSLIETLRVCDPNFNEPLEQHWRDMMRISIGYIVEGY
ncbi:MAG: globin [Gammaproteobacteria bacterium]|nr:globin [Gammaproteobacteria bacterium]